MLQFLYEFIRAIVLLAWGLVRAIIGLFCWIMFIDFLFGLFHDHHGDDC